LGLGLVIPALDKAKVPYVILQRPSKAWSKLLKSNSDTVGLSINGKPVTAPIKLYTDNEIDAGGLEISQIMSSVKDGGFGHLVLSNDTPTWESLLHGAKSFSTSVGGSVSNWLGPLLSSLPERELEDRPVLYACENDSNAVKELANQLAGRVEVVPCMVDRICAGREVTGDPDPVISVEAENHTGSIVLLNPPENPNAQIPLVGEAVTVPQTAAIGAYLYNRKVIMVNGMHTTLAFITMVWNEMQRSMGGPGEVAGYALEDLPLETYASAPEEVQEDIWCWSIAQILKLMWDNDEDLMREAHLANSNQELVDDFLSIAHLNQERFASLDDTTSRVLGGGVSNRYMGRLVPVQEAVHAVQAMSEKWGEHHPMKLLLDSAGLDMERVVTACDKLVGRSWRYCRRDEVLRAYIETGQELFTPEGGDSMASLTQASIESVKNTLSKHKILLDEAIDGEVQGPSSLLSEKMAVIFDFDGTLADSEVVAMEVNYWTLVPYLPEVEPVGIQSSALTPQARDDFMHKNAGRNFDALLAEVEAKRTDAGLPSIAETRANQAEDSRVLRAVDRMRTRMGLRTYADMRCEEAKEADIQEQQRKDVILALARMSQPNNHVTDTLEALTYLGIPFAIATTNGRPRVPLALKAAGLLHWFAPDKIHCGESDFPTPKFKPDPAVYHLAIEGEGTQPGNCIAVEDSAVGAAAAVDAGVGLVVGYVGSSHIPEEIEDHHAYSLLSGARSKSGVGADIVISDMSSLVAIVTFFKGLQERERPFSFPDAMINQMAGSAWLPSDYEEAMESGEVVDVSAAHT